MKSSGCLSGCAVVIFLALAIVAVVITRGIIEQVERSRMTPAERAASDQAEREARQAEHQKRAEEAEQRREAAEQREKARLEAEARATEKMASDLQAFREVSEAAELQPLIASVAASPYREHTIVLVVQPDWHYLSKAARLQAARSLHALWEKIHLSGGTTLAFIELTDQFGNEVGGSKLLGDVWVEE